MKANGPKLQPRIEVYVRRDRDSLASKNPHLSQPLWPLSHIHMTGRALSERVKQIAAAKAADRRLHEAAAAYRAAKAAGDPGASYRLVGDKH